MSETPIQAAIQPNATLKSTPETVLWGYIAANLPPALSVKSGQIVEIEALSHQGLTTNKDPEKFFAGYGIAANEVLADAKQVYAEVKRPKGASVHILTGPIYVDGAEPGDTLEIRVHDIKFRVPYGVNNTGPGKGVLPKLLKDATAKLIRIDLERRVALFSDDIQIPLNPFMGIMAVAPPTSLGLVSSTPPGAWGGNIDLKYTGIGSSLFLPVFNKGGQFFTGDGHAVQGDGEVDGGAIEISLKPTLQFIVHKGKTIKQPRVETATDYLTTGLDVDLNVATRIAMQEAVDFLQEEKGMSAADAYALSSLAVDLGIGEAVDIVNLVYAKIPKNIFKSNTEFWHKPDGKKTELETETETQEDNMDIAPLNQKTGYVRWMKSQGLPIHTGHGMADLRTLEVAPYARMGGRAAFIQLHGMQGITGGYIGEIPPGDALTPERHLYEEVICILNGQGATELWDDHGNKKMFEWDKWSLFAPPMNTTHRLVNGSREPVRFLAVTNAPLAFDIYRDENFVFNCPYSFKDRYYGEEDYFEVGKKRYVSGLINIWETNFIPDINAAMLESLEVKGAGLRLAQFEMAGNALVGHLGEWPVGKYHKAHHHGPGAIIVGTKSVGNVLLWHKQWGMHPYTDGHEDKVIDINWGEGSIYCPPGDWFHQHFNTGKEPARHLAVRYGSRIHPLGFKVSHQKTDDDVFRSVDEGGWMITYENEDPEIPKRYQAALRANGVVS